MLKYILKLWTSIPFELICMEGVSTFKPTCFNQIQSLTLCRSCNYTNRFPLDLYVFSWSTHFTCTRMHMVADNVKGILLYLARCANISICYWSSLRILWAYGVVSCFQLQKDTSFGDYVTLLAVMMMMSYELETWSARLTDNRPQRFVFKKLSWKHHSMFIWLSQFYKT